jgi:N-formylglutamate amidohydrolase
LNQAPERPDFSIGTDDFHTPNLLKLVSIEFFKQHGYSLGVDYPYSGSIVPMEHYQKNRAVGTIMLEINRKLYLEEGTNIKSANYPKIKEVVKAYLATIREHG